MSARREGACLKPSSPNDQVSPSRIFWNKRRPASQTTYYVSTSGSDGRSCAQAQSQSTPKLTLNNAVGCLRAGDTLFVRGGVYEEWLLVNVPSGTSWSNKVRIAALPGETVWLRPYSGPHVRELPVPSCLGVSGVSSTSNLTGSILMGRISRTTSSRSKLV